MNSKQQRPLKKLLGIRGMGAALTAFVGLIIIYIAFGIINPAVFSGQNMLNLLRSMSKYLLIGIAQSYVLITGNIDLSIGSMVGMSAMIAATLMTGGMSPILAILIALLSCLVIGIINGYLVGKFKLPPFIATLGTMFVARDGSFPNVEESLKKIKEATLRLSEGYALRLSNINLGLYTRRNLDYASIVLSDLDMFYTELYYEYRKPRIGDDSN